jgi:hypothetical protein
MQSRPVTLLLVAWNARRYSPWLLKHEERLRNRRDALTRLLMFLAVLIGIIEALLPWQSLTPPVPWWAHIAVAAVSLPIFYFLWQADFQRKEQAFALAMSDKGRRVLFLDPYLEPEEFALSEQIQGAHLLPLQRQLDAAFRTGAGTSLSRRLDYFYRMLPSPVHEGDRLGPLSILHPVTFVSWGIGLGLTIALLPGFGIGIAGMRGLTLLPLLLLLFLFANRANTRFAYESALYDWLRMG